MAVWKRGLDWDAMTDEERIDLVNDIVHEVRPFYKYLHNPLTVQN